MAINAISANVTSMGVDDDGVTFVEFNGPSGVTLSLSEEQRLGLLAALSEATLHSIEQGRAPLSLHLEAVNSRPLEGGREVILDFRTAANWVMSVVCPRSFLPRIRDEIARLEAGWDTPSANGMN